MTKLRTKTQVMDRIDGAFALRLSELEYLKTIVFKASGAAQSSAARAAYPMVYAHWEGFIRDTTGAYLEYVTNVVGIKRIKNARVLPSLLAGWAWQAGVKDEKPTLYTFLECTISTVFDLESIHSMELAPIPRAQGIIDSGRFRQLCRLVDLDYSRFATRERFIDEVLAGRRHLIVHGALDPVSVSDFDTVRNEGLALMRQYKDEIANLIATDGYMTI